MRNWNIFSLCSAVNISYRFYSTYEELKLDFLEFCIKIFLSFYSTYEELKPW